MKTMFLKLTLTAVAVVCVALSGRPAQAQANKPAPSGFGSVDLQRVFNEYKLKQTSSDQAQAFGQGKERVLQRLVDASAVFLPDAEGRELAGLYEKAAPSDAEKTRITALENKARGLSDELRGLQNVAAPNDQQKARLAELSGAQSKGRETFQTLQQNFRTQVEQLNAQLTQKIADDIKAAVARQAQEKNLAVVFDAVVAVYTANDITADVIKQLNK